MFRQTDRQTDRETEMLYQYRAVSILMHDEMVALKMQLFN